MVWNRESWKCKSKSMISRNLMCLIMSISNRRLKRHSDLECTQIQNADDKRSNLRNSPGFKLRWKSLKLMFAVRTTLVFWAGKHGGLSHLLSKSQLCIKHSGKTANAGLCFGDGDALLSQRGNPSFSIYCQPGSKCYILLSANLSQFVSTNQYFGSLILLTVS